MHDLHPEHPHPSRPRLTDVSLATDEFDEQCEVASACVSSLEENCLSKRKRWCRNKIKSSECCEHKSDSRTTAGIQVGCVRRGETHVAEEFVVVHEYGLDQLRSKRPVEVLEL